VRKRVDVFDTAQGLVLVVLVFNFTCPHVCKLNYNLQLCVW